MREVACPKHNWVSEPSYILREAFARFQTLFFLTSEIAEEFDRVARLARNEVPPRLLTHATLYIILLVVPVRVRMIARLLIKVVNPGRAVDIRIVL